MEGQTTGPPDFVGIGTQRAGTSWWHRLVLAHPGVYRRPDARKELHFFQLGAATNGIESPAAYHASFPRPPATITGEWTPRYIYDPWTPRLLRAVAPDAKLLVLLRDPVARFVSGIHHELRVGAAFDRNTVADA